MNEADSPLNQEFAQAADNPADFDFGFEEQRRECGYANFGFPPDEAAKMREQELTRIAKELEGEPMDYEEYDEDEDDFLDDDISDRDEFDGDEWDNEEEDDDDFDYLDDDDDDYDRYSDALSLDDLDDEDD